MIAHEENRMWMAFYLLGSESAELANLGPVALFAHHLDIVERVALKVRVPL